VVGGTNRPAWRAATHALALICAHCARGAAVLPPRPLALSLKLLFVVAHTFCA